MTNTEVYRLAVKKMNDNGAFYIPRLMIDRSVLDDCEIYYNIFSHDFAKAFFGQNIICNHCGGVYDMKYDICQDAKLRSCMLGSDYPDPIEEWAYHLQKMVLEENPLKYLEKFL